MRDEWVSVLLADAVTINPTRRLERSEPYPFVDMAKIEPGRRSVQSKNYRQFNGGGSRFRSGDTLFARITPCLENGKISQFVSELDTCSHGSTEFIILAGREGVTENNYVYYLMLSPEIRNFAVSQMNGSSGRQRVSTDALGTFPIFLPPIAEQKAIASILGALDDKIELNRKMSETLEEMARALFKSWFVDFDPVRAKAEGRDTGLPDHIAELFPDSFEDSELGAIPKGWVVSSISNIADLVQKTSYPSRQAAAIWEHYSIPAFDSGRVPFNEFGETIKSNKYVVPENSILLSKLNPATPRVWMANVHDESRAICSTEFLPFVAKGFCDRSYLYELMTSDVFRSDLNSKVSGSTGSRQRVLPSNVLSISIIIPSDHLIKTYSNFASWVHLKILNLIFEGSQLCLLRDLLLSKLISGDIRINRPQAFLNKIETIA